MGRPSVSIDLKKKSRGFFSQIGKLHRFVSLALPYDDAVVPPPHEVRAPAPPQAGEARRGEAELTLEVKVSASTSAATPVPVPVAASVAASAVEQVRQALREVEVIEELGGCQGEEDAEEEEETERHGDLDLGSTVAVTFTLTLTITRSRRLANNLFIFRCFVEVYFCFFRSADWLIRGNGERAF